MKLAGHFVQTNICIGLTEGRAQMAKEILLGQTGEKPTPAEALAW